MSELINFVATWSRLEESYRVDPHVMCKGSWGGEQFWFLVTDDGWNGWFVAQYPRPFIRDRLTEVESLIASIGNRGSHMFRFDFNDGGGLVRAVFQLSLANELRVEDDVPAAASSLQRNWATLLPFLRRIETGEMASDLFEQAKARFDALDLAERPPSAAR